MLFLAGCGTDGEKLFQLIDSSDSGIKFINKIYEDEEHVNIIALEYVYNGGGVSIGDFNNDGLNDIFFTGNMVANKLYLNQGDLKFKDVSKQSGTEAFNKWKSGSAVVDINNDGWLDIYVCATISGDDDVRRNMLFENQGLNEEGDPVFIDKAKQYGIDYSGFSSNAAFFDFDNDGDLDLYILTNYRQKGVPVTYRPKINDGSSLTSDRLYRNNGNGTFTDVSKEMGVLCEGYGLGLAFFDVNKDGWLDIYAGNDYISNDLLYINQGNGKFQNEIDNLIKHQSKFSMGNDVADINNDGYLDLITVDMLPESNFRKKTVISSAGYTTYINDRRYGYAHQHVRNMLQLNNGNGSFSEIGQLTGVYQTEWSWSPLFADFDNDGLKDLIITNGFPRDITDRDFISFREKVHGLASTKDLLKELPSVLVPNYVYKNNGDLTFTNVTKEWGMDQPSFSSGAAYADLDNDGDLDYVVNNIDQLASLYENKLYSHSSKSTSSTNYLRLKLIGSTGNTSGLGTKITLYHSGGKIQYTEHNIYRGYISTVEDVVHFGLGQVTSIDSVLIEWLGGKHQTLKSVSSNQVLVIKESDAIQSSRPSAENEPAIFEKVSHRTSGIVYQHVEPDRIDFNVQRTLPHKFSQQGPGIAVGDVNGDKLEDFIVGGAATQPITLFLQQKNGKFLERKITDEKPEEDNGILLFDADSDGDLDLYAVSGSYEFEPGSQNYQDRLYLNDGRGNFKLSTNAVPAARASGSCVRAADFDQDGDLDLFVGGRVTPGKYPFSEQSFLFQNTSGVFTDVTEQWSTDLRNIGIVSDAIWSDYDNDGKTDLIVVGEYMTVTFFKNTGSSFEKNTASGIENYFGWFNSIQAGDFDSDGDMDYVAGNLGLNHYYNTSMTQPLTVWAKDFDGNGSIDAILSCYAKADDGTLKSYPIHFWEDLNSQSPLFRRKFSLYKDFAKVTTESFFTPAELKDALHLKATYMATCYIENLGSGKFKINEFPNLVQVAPVNGIQVDDVNEDGHLDIIMVGNDYSYEPNTGQFDAFTGLVLLGDGKGNFNVLPSVTSGFFVNGDSKGLVRLRGVHNDLFIATQNKDSVSVFRKSFQEKLEVLTPTSLDTRAEFYYTDGRKQRVEFYYGSGYLSQSTRRIRIPAGVQKITVFDSKGDTRTVIPGNQ
ncbi:MAG: VCBS repeat-containing protein [Cyclobacteriaceae bacterium]|nr:VCBS repeat-containing protein [Cyclobacteriaceae bacterium]